MLKRLRLRDEQGIALAMALMVMLVLGILVAGVIGFSTSNASSSDRTRVDEATLYAAESGIEQALSRLNQAASPTVANLLPSTTTTVGASSVTYSGAYNAGTRQWTITSTATTPSPAGGTAPLDRTIVQDLQAASGVPTLATNPAWNYIYADNASGCTTFDSSVQISQPIYVKNDLCLGSSVRILNTANEVNVGGPNGITMNSSAEIGASGANLPTLRVANRGCRYSTNAYSWPCSALAPSAGQRVRATTQTTSLPPVSKPASNFAARYLDASPGPMDFCDNAGSNLPANFFETNAVVNDRSAGDRNLLPNSNYDCQTAFGRLRWVQSGGVGTLTISGVIFIDGNIVMNSSSQALISGRGTIYVSGWVQLDSSTRICGKVLSGGECDWTGWNPETNMLVLAAGGAGPAGTLPGELVSVSLNSSVYFQGALWGENMIKVDSSVLSQGPLVANKIKFDSSVNTRMIPFTTMPNGAPGTPAWTVTPIAGTWREP